MRARRIQAIRDMILGDFNQAGQLIKKNAMFVDYRLQ